MGSLGTVDAVSAGWIDGAPLGYSGVGPLRAPEGPSRARTEGVGGGEWVWGRSQGTGGQSKHHDGGLCVTVGWDRLPTGSVPNE